jgi:hypothetical protein
VKQSEERSASSERSVYTSPSVKLIEIRADVITMSAGDPNMGEWDTEM